MHPSESSLALYAGDDLGLYPRWRLSRHLRNCETCRAQVEHMTSVRDWMRAEDDELPAGVDWDALAREMKANIRVGFAAGECVAETPRRRFTWQPAMALPLLLVVLAGWLIQSWPHAVPGPLPQERMAAFGPAGPVLDATAAGIGLERDGRSFRLLHPGAESVRYTVNGSGSLGSRYVDAETGYVTISHVYAQ